jgi:ribonuclease P protein subunit RPR2
MGKEEKKTQKTCKAGVGAAAAAGRPTTQKHPHLHARVDYLYRAAVYLQTLPRPVGEGAGTEKAGEKKTVNQTTGSSPQTHHLLTSMRSVSQKGQIRLPRPIKRSVCRRCNGLLFSTPLPLPFPSSTHSSLSPDSATSFSSAFASWVAEPATVAGDDGSIVADRDDGGGSGCGKAQIENLSKGGRKPWADVLVVRCRVCGFVKRYPVGARRQRKKKDDEKDGEATLALDTAAIPATTTTAEAMGS